MTSWLRLRDGARYAGRLAAVLLVLVGESAILSAAAGADNTVRLIVDYGDGVAKTISDLAWSKGNTVLDAMKAATSRPHGISFSYTGSGASAAVTKIDDVQSQGGGAGKDFTGAVRQVWKAAPKGAAGNGKVARWVGVPRSGLDSWCPGSPKAGDPGRPLLSASEGRRHPPVVATLLVDDACPS